MNLTGRLKAMEKVTAARRTNPRCLEAIRKDRAAILELAKVNPDKWQRDLLRARPHRGIALCSRQSGKSTYGAADCLSTALCESNALVLIVSPTLRQSAEAFRKAVGLWRALGKPVAAESVNKTSLELVNGSRIVACPGDPDGLVGFSNPKLILIDEASRIQDELYFALSPMTALGGRIVMTSTPFGPRGIFHSMWSEGGPDWHRAQVKATDCPRISKTFLANELRTLGPKWYAQEFLCDFTSAAGCVFDPLDIKAACRMPEWVSE